MGFIKYSVVELGVESDVPGWVKRAGNVKPADAEVIAEQDEDPANIKLEEQEEIATKE